MKPVLIAFPTSWDRRQVSSVTRDVVLHGPTDEERPDDFDVAAFLDATVSTFRGRVDGVTSASDYPGAMAAAVLAERLGLPGSDPAAVIRASHKFYSRMAQQQAAPESVPRFALVDPRSPRSPFFPCFVKPVKGSFSILARRLESQTEMDAFFARPAVRGYLDGYMRMFNRLVADHTDLAIDGRAFVAEDLIPGLPVTVEGFVGPSGVTILGVVDSVLHPNGSFARFDYPSALPGPLQARMGDIARRVVAALGLRATMFNVEMAWDEASDRVAIFEVNPRMAGQFADLYEKVDGINSFEIAAALACGDEPVVPRRGAYACASSLPLRVFAPCRVAAAPTEDRVREVEREFPGARAWVECAAGQALSDFESLEDGRSFRYAVVNAGAESRQAMAGRLARIVKGLAFEFEDPGPGTCAVPSPPLS